MTFTMSLIRSPQKKQRPVTQLREHYKIERELADRLRNSAKEDRGKLYTEIYNELYRRVPDHPQITQKACLKAQHRVIASQLRLLSGFLKRETVFLEIGPGDCQLSFEIAKRVKKVYAIDISEEITKGSQRPKDFELILSSDINMDIFNQNIHVAYSNQVMEHIHPNDALGQLQGIYKALIPGGVYICVTPHRFTGPHDISAYFDHIATGLHLKEYTNRELYDLFKTAGFSKTWSCLNLRFAYIRVPIYIVIALEQLLGALPYGLKKMISRTLLFRSILGIRIIAAR